MPERTSSYIFAGGGTGGHIFPAIALAEALAERQPDARFEWLVSDRTIDSTILSARDRAHTPIPAKPFVVSPMGLARFVGSWGASVRAARQRLQDAKAHGPAVLVAMGGFVCPPAVQAARAERVPVALVNLDAVPGRANRWVAKRAEHVISACPAFGWDVVGPIVRAEALPSGDAAACRAALGLDPDVPTLFVSGGSQGAGSINDLIPAFARRSAEALRGWQILHQAGAGRSEPVERSYRDAGGRATVVEFIDRVGDAWGAADVAIARAGAGSVAEAWASRTPTVFFPYPHHADEHQRANAAALETAGGALILTDHADADRNLDAHAGTIAGLLADAGRRAAMRSALEGLGPSDGAARAAAVLADLA
ncbi:MAG: glycosyltransferase [Phycisphaerales bacterium]